MTTAEISDDLAPAPAPDLSGGGAEPLSCAAIYEDNFDFVWRNARRLGVEESSCEDVVHEVFLVVQRRLGAFEGRSSVRTWLWGILERVAREHRRRHRMRVSREAAAALEASDRSDPGALEAMARKEATRIVDAILAGMDEEKRSMFVLVDLEEVSVVEAARGLGINLNTAHARLRAARSIFAEAVKRIHAQSSHDETASGFWWWRRR